MSNKSVSDPVHGLIRLGQMESELLATSAMQRLHGVHQLGLAYMVYPGAKYTRHAHSIGAYHNATKLMAALKNNLGQTAFEKFAPQSHVQNCSVIALMHDIGHYPFSHATEHVIKDYFSSNTSGNGILVSSSQNSQARSGSIEGGINHEKMGAYIISRDPEVAGVLKKYGLDPEEVARCFRGKNPDFKLLGVISSDLDCDRLDYLRRTAHNSGAPYGSIDVEFLIEQATFDRDGNFCFKDKAARAADHLLISRFYDYMQVPYNKTAVAIEWSLHECLKEAFRQKRIKPSGDAMRSLVDNGEWPSFDDQHVMSIFRKMTEDAEPRSVLHDHLRAIQRREPAKLVATWDTLRFRRDTKFSGEPVISDDVKDTYSAHVKVRDQLSTIVKTIADQCGLDPKRLNAWDAKVSFMKDGQELDNTSQSEPEYYAEGVHLFDAVSRNAGRIGARQDMLIGTLKHKYMSAVRLYYLPHSSERGEMDAIYENIGKCLRNAMPRPTWAAA